MSEGYDHLAFLHIKEQRNNSSRIVAVVAGWPGFAAAKLLLLFFHTEFSITFNLYILFYTDFVYIGYAINVAILNLFKIMSWTDK